MTFSNPVKSLRTTGVWRTFILSSLLLTSQAYGNITYRSSPFPPSASNMIGVCSFNIQWLGHWKLKEYDKLAQVIRNCDAIAIQELIAPPWEVRVRNKNGSATILPKDEESAKFVDAMAKVGFDGIILAEEDTGPNANHVNTTSSEWPVLFYKKSLFTESKSLPTGYLALDRVKHPIYSRVPYAFALKSKKDGQDFVIISVHLTPTTSSQTLYSKARRIAEFQLIAEWIEWQLDNHGSGEQDFFVIGDMNVEDFEEYNGYFGHITTKLDPYVDQVIDQGGRVSPRVKLLDFESLNQDQGKLFATNIRLNKPFDHFMYDQSSLSVTLDSTLEIIDLGKYFHIDSFETTSAFIQHYSDHNPLRMLIRSGPDRD